MRPGRAARAAGLAAGIVLVLGGGCADDADGYGDAPVGRLDDTPADIVNMPDGYPNVATKCVPYQPGKRVYVVTHGNSDVPPVIVDDPSCGGAEGER